MDGARAITVESVMPKSERRLAGLFCAIAALIALVAGGCADMDGFLFNTQTVDRYHPPASIPDSALEQVILDSEGNSLYGYWIEADGAHAGGPHANVTILYCHGNKHSMDEYWDRVEFLRRLGANIFTFDYRGFGLSEGTSSEAGLHADADAALAEVRRRGFADADIVLYGFSLGNVASIHLAADRIEPRALIAEAPFASSTALAQGGMALDFPARWLTEGTYDNAETIRRVRAPLLLLHGEDDDFVRYRDNGRLVYANANEPKSLIVVPGANHTDVPQTMGVDRYLEELRRWMGLQ